MASTSEKVWTISELNELIEEKKSIISINRSMETTALAVLQKQTNFMGKERTVSEQLEVDTARKNYDIATKRISEETYELLDLEEKLRKIEFANEINEILRVPVRRLSPVMSDKHAQARSTSGSSSSQRKRIELDKKQMLMALRHEYEEVKEQLDLDLAIQNSLPDSQDKLTELARLEIKLKHLESSYARKMRQAEDESKLRLEMAEADDDYQSFGSGSEDGSPPIAKGNRLPGPKAEKQSREYPFPPRAAEAGQTLDKDMMMIHLMQSQLNMMQKSTGGFVDKKLPEFTGDPKDWSNFKSAFDRTNRKFHLEHGENLGRLQLALKGEARAAVEHLMSNVSNVPKIMETLERRFGRPEFILDYLLERIKACPKPEIGKPKTIVDFGTAVQSLVINVNAYQEQDYMTSKQLVNELVDKLPGTLKDKWFGYLFQDVRRKANLKTFSEWLEEPFGIALLQMKPGVHPTGGDEKKNIKKERVRGNVNVAEGEEKFSRDKRCQVCNGTSHRLNSCWSFKKKTLDERWKLVKQAKVCYYCLKEGHTTATCEDAKECGKDGCTRKHHHLLHSSPKQERSDKVKETSEEDEMTTKDDGVIAILDSIVKGTDGPLPIVPVRIKGNGGRIRIAFALLDSGATRTLIGQNLANELNLKGTPHPYSFRIMSGPIVNEEKAEKVNFQISGKYRNARMWHITDAITVSKIGLSKYSLDVEKAKEKWPHLRRYKGPSLQSVTPEIIIGGDHGFLLMHRELLFNNEEEPVGMRTVLGWILQGKLSSASSIGTGFHVGGYTLDSLLHDMIKESFKFEEFTSASQQELSMSRRDRKALEIMEQTAKQGADGRWEIGHLWKSNEPFPSNGYNEALSRLAKTEQRMRKDPEFAGVYKEKIQEYIHKGYIKKLSPEEVAVRSGRTRYISHFGVRNPNKPGKFRFVFDAAEKAAGSSLNDHLLTGPDLLRPLPTLLWNFRKFVIVICGDIEDMFHRIYLKTEDRCAQRFLWRGGDSNKNPDEYEMLVLMFGSSGSPSCAIYIKNKNAERFQDEFPDAVKAIIDGTYTDDCLSGADTVERAIKLREEITNINKEGGFVIKKWMSNSQEVMDSIPEEYRSFGEKALGNAVLEAERVLGLWWDPREDEFTFVLKFNKVNQDVLGGIVPTKREVCSLVMSLFDPLGFVAHYKVKGLIILQQIWKSGVDWDTRIPDDIYHAWTQWLSHLKKLPEVRVPRCYSLCLEIADVQLHTMVDASAEAFCAICYLRVETKNGVEVSFVNANVKVAPIKKKTIPRLELDAAVLGAKLSRKIMKELDVQISKCYYWSDSSTVLYWIRSESSRFKKYVANRIGLIQESTEVGDWRWIPTRENVADEATRLDKISDFSPKSRWLNGPQFLRLDEAEWPIEHSIGVIGAAIVEEVLGDATGVSFFIDEGRRLVAGKNLKETIPEVTRFSNYYRLLRSTAAVRVAARYWKSLLKNENRLIAPWKLTKEKFESFITTRDVQEAEKAVIMSCQVDLGNLKKFKNLAPATDQDGIIRVRGRLENAECLEKGTRMPILLPAKRYIVDLIINDEHRRCAHTGRNTVYNNLRQKFWIEDGRHAVRKSWTRCNLCRMQRAKPVVPEMGNLPACRLEAHTPPFAYTGVDCFGPIEVTVGRRHEKRWGVLFTDLVTRGVHLEVAASCSADDMMLVISRFVDCRGLPRHIYSDNATNFHAVAKEVEKRSKYHGCEWHFIPAASPHMGGVWETLVKETKRVLKNLFDEKYPKEQVLLTALKAVENIVNSRPLCYVSGDLDDPASLTPNHFIRGVGLASTVLEDQAATTGSLYFGEDVTDDKKRWNKMWEKAQALANTFWDRWKTNVLPSLLRRNKWTDQKEPIQVGDIVIMVDELSLRRNWKKAVVTKLFPGKDGVVRVVEVMSRNFKTKTCSTYKRAVAKICPIGVRCDSVTVHGVTKSGGRK